LDWANVQDPFLLWGLRGAKQNKFRSKTPVLLSRGLMQNKFLLGLCHEPDFTSRKHISAFNVTIKQNLFFKFCGS
jgi:hypothetical protein